MATKKHLQNTCTRLFPSELSGFLNRLIDKVAPDGKPVVFAINMTFIALGIIALLVLINSLISFLLEVKQ